MAEPLAVLIGSGSVRPQIAPVRSTRPRAGVSCERLAGAIAANGPRGHGEIMRWAVGERQLAALAAGAFRAVWA